MPPIRDATTGTPASSASISDSDPLPSCMDGSTKTSAFPDVLGRIRYPAYDRSHVIGPGECTTVKPNEYHRFLTQEFQAEAIELYYLQQLGEDIVRKD